MFGTIRRSMKGKVRLESQLKLYKMVAVPTAIYRSETWTVTKKIKTRIQTAEIVSLRGAAGYTRADHLRNTEIREELKVFSLNIKIQSYKNNWLQHLHRMEDSRIPKQTWQYHPHGNRRLGRPMKRWSDQI
jgi:hypothetical protein